jgi:hypothetical protein
MYETEIFGMKKFSSFFFNIHCQSHLLQVTATRFGQPNALPPKKVVKWHSLVVAEHC